MKFSPEKKNIFWFSFLATIFFVILKIPMLYLVLGNEELRDLDGYIRASNGEVPFRDFGWLYGPFGPMVFGYLLKFFGLTIFSLRAVALVFWAAGIFLMSTILMSIIRNRLIAFLTISLVSFPFGYASYAHNHVIAFCGLMLTCYGIFIYREEKKEVGIWISLVGILIVLFCRPLLMGYGLTFGWLVWLAWEPKLKKRSKYFCVLFGFILVLSIFFYWRTGPSLRLAFIPQKWLMLPQEGYPNVISALGWFNHASGPIHRIKALRGLWEVLVFYLHYFIWPTMILTFAYVQRNNQKVRTACIFVCLSVLSSFDILYYGLGYALINPALGIRAQFFILPVILSVYLCLFDQGRSSRLTFKTWAVAGAFSIFVFIWGVFPYVAGIYQLKNFSTNPFGIPSLVNLRFHPRDTASINLINFLDSQCSEKDSMIISGYDPVMTLAKCRNIFARFLYTLQSDYKVTQNETPYTPTQDIIWGDLVRGKEAELKPRFYVNFLETEKPCNLPGWKREVFEAAGETKSLCWLAKD